MGTMTVTLEAGQRPTREELARARKEYREAKKLPPASDPDCPPSAPEALAEFAAMARAKKKKDPRPVVALRIQPDVLEKYKALGRGYSGIMADVLKLAADNPEILSKARA